MAPFLYICPNTGFRVQAYAPEQTSDGEDTYQAIKCLMCTQLHLVNLTTGHVLGLDGE
jgi:hypothetical protein